MADSEFDRLTKAAEGKHIRLEPNAAQDCAKLCSDMVTQLNSAINNAKTLGNVKGFGDLPDATALAQRYSDRATNGDSSLEYALKKHVEVVNDMMDTFIAAGRAYLEHEKASADELAKYDTTTKGYRK
ncbi:hypothetical protein ACWDYH_08880 [Nocardia goodfellowii]|uniref:PE domain-containing protein n=1 Tax=Nocardia goodfellowii TaxID=882446 RepID=A0ABS4QF31_9NOCA|nr:hypothetical protein [Nocardia goodfellowii]MBP2189698.1 hypothetical protein [Nocardia goodfellowii]